MGASLVHLLMSLQNFVRMKVDDNALSAPASIISKSQNVRNLAT